VYDAVLMIGGRSAFFTAYYIKTKARDPTDRPAHVAEWFMHSTASVAMVRLSPGLSAYQRFISDNSYAHHEGGVNPGQVRGFHDVLYNL